MSVVLLLITDGRMDYLERCVVSAANHLQGPISRRVMFDDTGDAYHRDGLKELFPEFEHVNCGPRQGFGGAIRASWSHLRTLADFEYVFHLEQDFVFNRPVALEYVTALLDEQPDIVQVAFRRQPWNENEQAAGGIVEQYPHAYTDCVSNLGCPYLTQRMFFTTNPCVYRRSLLDVEWPTGPHSEGFFSHRLLNDPAAKFAYWGARHSTPWVEHIGQQRVGVGY